VMPCIITAPMHIQHAKNLGTSPLIFLMFEARSL
jgi:hypothetical protein